MLTTVMIMVSVGVTACLVILISCLFRRRCCQTFDVSAQEDVELSSSHDNSVEDIIELTRNKDKDETYFKRWVTRWHRSADTTKKIIRTVFSLKPNATLGHEWNDDASQISPEYVAVPARMADKLAPTELELGDFTGDSTQQFKHIYRASRLSSKSKSDHIQPAAGSPHYQRTEILRNSNSHNHSHNDAMVSFLNSTCCVDGQPTSPYFDDLASRPSKASKRPTSGASSVVSVLTSPTVTADSGEMNPVHNSRPSSVQNDIYTIYEDTSDISVDSLDPSFHPSMKLLAPDDTSMQLGKLGNKVHLRGVELQKRLVARDGQYYVDTFHSSTSPMLKNSVYSGYIKQQSFSPTKFSV